MDWNKYLVEKPLFHPQTIACNAQYVELSNFNWQRIAASRTKKICVSILERERKEEGNRFKEISIRGKW